jgi:hypothetical protein
VIVRRLINIRNNENKSSICSGRIDQLPLLYVLHLNVPVMFKSYLNVRPR